jgi:hypothetical protein
MELDKLQTPKITINLAAYVRLLLQGRPYRLIDYATAQSILACHNHILVCKVIETNIRDARTGLNEYHLIAIDGMEAFKELEDRQNKLRQEKIKQWSLSDKERKKVTAILTLAGIKQKDQRKILTDQKLFNQYKQLLNM